MTHTPPELDVIAAFRRQSAELPEPVQGTRRAPAIAAATVVAAVALGAVLDGTGGSPEALAITRTATTLELRLADASADPGELTRELNEETVRLDDIESANTVLRIPVARVLASTGSFLLVAGREPRAGERAIDLSSPETVQREVFEPVLGSSPARLPACP